MAVRVSSDLANTPSVLEINRQKWYDIVSKQRQTLVQKVFGHTHVRSFYLKILFFLNLINSDYIMVGHLVQPN